MPTYEANGLDSESIKKLNKELMAFRTKAKRDVKNICNRLAEIGKSRAEIEFAAVPYDGEKDVSLSVGFHKAYGAKSFGFSAWGAAYFNVTVLSATGETVYFLEYGSGAFQPPYAGETTPGLERGSWSLSEKGKGHWDDPNGWYVSHGVKSWGNPPANAMYHAEQEIRRNADRVIQEVLNQQ